MRIEQRAAIVICLALCVAGCEVGPDYHAPKMKVPSQFGDAPEQSTTRPVLLAEWWTTFGDKELNSLVKRAVAGNLDLRQAESRVREARYQRDIAAADLWPNVNADGGYEHARGSKNVVIPKGAFGGGGAGSSAGGTGASPAIRPAVADPSSGGASAAASGGASGGAPLGPESPLGEGGLPGVSTDLYQIGFDATWEIDVFGGARRALEAAEAQQGAAIEDRRNVLVTLLAEVARNYVELRGLQQEEMIARANLADQQETLELIKSKWHNGLATDLDVSRQQEEVSTTAATLPPLMASEHQAIHALGILLGKPPQALNAELMEAGPVPMTPPDIPVGLPSQLLRRRPDIRQAERQLAAATAQIGVATADLFPKFDLTGSMGLDATDVSRLLEWDSRYYSFVPGVSWAVFDAGRIRANIRVQNELQSQALEAYQETVLNALKDVDDALVQYNMEELRHKSLLDAASAGQEAVKLARDQYDRGVTDFLTVLDTERSLLEAQDSLAQSDQAIAEDVVALYKALGGGWEKLDGAVAKKGS